MFAYSTTTTCKETNLSMQFISGKFYHPPNSPQKVQIAIKN